MIGRPGAVLVGAGLVALVCWAGCTTDEVQLWEKEQRGDATPDVAPDLDTKNCTKTTDLPGKVCWECNDPKTGFMTGSWCTFLLCEPQPLDAGAGCPSCFCERCYWTSTTTKDKTLCGKVCWTDVYKKTLMSSECHQADGGV